MSYYAERNQLLGSDFSIDINDLRKFFYQIYMYFDNKGYFVAAFDGVIKQERFDSRRIMPPLLAPSPEIFFMNHLNSTNVLPIYENYEFFNESELFTIIEILYDHIGYYDFGADKFVTDEPKREFAEHMNNILKRFGDGFYLVESQGFIMQQPNMALKEMMNAERIETMSEKVLEQLQTAAYMYYKHDANLEQKKKAINILADILESVREKLKNILNDEFKIPKNEHDKLIFGIVNAYEIRHDNDKQLSKYSKSIWYDWMMQYYTSVILTYYKLLEKYQD